MNKLEKQLLKDFKYIDENYSIALENSKYGNSKVFFRNCNKILLTDLVLFNLAVKDLNLITELVQYMSDDLLVYLICNYPCNGKWMENIKLNNIQEGLLLRNIKDQLQGKTNHLTDLALYFGDKKSSGQKTINIVSSMMVLIDNYHIRYSILSVIYSCFQSFSNGNHINDILISKEICLKYMEKIQKHHNYSVAKMIQDEINSL